VTKVYLKKNTIRGAWDYIHRGYYEAWKSLGYEAIEYLSLKDIPPDETDYYLMIRDWDISGERDISALSRAKKAFLFAQANTFPLPWGSHPNFISHCPDGMVNKINQMENVYLWTFGDMPAELTKQLFFKWKEIHKVLLAFDSINYKPIHDQNYNYDVCFVGGWANNGFDEKRKIMLKQFYHFKDSGLKCGFFINRGLSHQQENALLYNSKVSINIHDAYQRKFGFDTNERTFKSLGLNGILISDEIDQLQKTFPNVKTSNDPVEMVRLTKEYVSMTEKELSDIKEENRQNILDNHCYVHRVQQFLSLGE
jgi:hypothetical protein